MKGRALVAAPDSRARALLRAAFDAAVTAVDPAAAVGREVTARDGVLQVGDRALPARARVFVLAVGKAAAPMALAFAERARPWMPQDSASGLVVTKDGHALPGLDRAGFEVRETAHPVPDARCEAAAHEARALVERARPEDVLVVLLSGGASSLLACPAPPLGLGDLADTTRVLLACGADIEEQNAVRKHLSAVAGGRLAVSSGAGQTHVLALSDVPGDRLDVIGSGPFSPDPNAFADALGVLERYGVCDRVPPAVRDHLRAGAAGEREDTPGPDHPAFARVFARVLACNRDARWAAVAAARDGGVRALDLGACLSGEARRAGRRIAALARGVGARDPVCLVAGGETTVSLTGDGLGGRSQELALAAAIALDGTSGVTLLAAGTDGTDGPTEAAGAFADGGTVGRARAAGVEARAHLERNDSHPFFAAEGGVFAPGPTRTNVMDLVLVHVAGTEADPKARV